MDMQMYHNLKDMLCDELEQITRKGELTAGSLETIDKLTHSIKSIETIIAMHDSGYSNTHPYYNDGRYSGKRDAMGRYSRGYSRDDSRDGMIHDLRELMQDAPDEHTRKRFQSFIRELENA